MSRPDITQKEILAVNRVLATPHLALGPNLEKFERAFADYIGARHGIAVSSGTSGLHMCVVAAGIGPGDEVITTPLTFAATANVIVHVGATPVLADICADDLNIDPDEIERKITPRTKALLPVHYGGQACRMDEVLDIARRHNLRVIEDAATAAGSLYKGQPVGSFGDATAFSFYAIKNMTTGQGGMVTTNDAAIAERVSALRNHGLDSNAWNRYAADGKAFYTVSEPGFNYGMTDLQASIGIGQLSRLDEFNAQRTKLAAHYTERFTGLPEVETPTVRPDATSNWHLYVLRLRLDRLTLDRDAFIDALKARGIGSAVHYFPVHYHSYYRERFGFQKGDYPVSEREFERLVSLPLFPLMTEREVDRVVAAVEAIVDAHRA